LGEVGGEGQGYVVLADVERVHRISELLRGDARPETSREELGRACPEVPELAQLSRQAELPGVRGLRRGGAGGGEVRPVPEGHARRLQVRAQVIQPQPLA
jgi:hypothetical protein